jgi:hypothetical protein
MSLGELHSVIQTVFGWTGSHLHEFEIGAKRYGEPEELDDPDIVAEGRVSLAAVLGKRTKRFLYTYDFGDDWRHEIVVEKVEPAGPGEDRAVCVAGKRQGPPEDCGGPWGYVDFLEAIGDPQHARHEELADWIGGEFDPEAFELEAINRNLAALKAPRVGRGGECS